MIGAIYGGAIFYNAGEALEVAGPAGMLTATIVVAVVTMCVGECISEFVRNSHPSRTSHC